MFDLERDSAIDASIMTLTALSVKAAPYQGALNLQGRKVQSFPDNTKKMARKFILARDYSSMLK